MNHWGNKPVADEDNSSKDDETKGHAMDKSHAGALDQGSKDEETKGDDMDI